MATAGDVPKLGFGAGAIKYVVLFGFDASNNAAGTGQTAAFTLAGYARQSFALAGEAQQSFTLAGEARQSFTLDGDGGP